MADNVKSYVAVQKKFCVDFKRIKREDDPQKCPCYFDIQVLEALTDSEQDSLAQQVTPSGSRAEEICVALKIDMTKYNKAIMGFLSQLPVQSDGPSTLDGENHFKMIENLVKNQKKRAKE